MLLRKISFFLVKKNNFFVYDNKLCLFSAALFLELQDGEPATTAEVGHPCSEWDHPCH